MGQTLEDISIVDSDSVYFLTLTFDEVPSYAISENIDPPSFSINFIRGKWEKGDFIRRVANNPVYQYSIKSKATSSKRNDLELRLHFYTYKKKMSYQCRRRQIFKFIFSPFAVRVLNLL